MVSESDFEKDKVREEKEWGRRLEKEDVDGKRCTCYIEVMRKFEVLVFCV